MRKAGRRVRLAGGLACVLALACASDPDVRRSLEERIADQPVRYEQPPAQRASELWSPAMLKGARYEVADPVATDGFQRIYHIRSDWGEYEVRGDDLLVERVREIRALDSLSQMSRTREFANAVGRALATPFVATWNLITRPVNTIAGIPAGALQAISKAPGLTRGERGELEDSALRELTGFGRKKRQLAWELQVDPYSSNGPLQQELNRHAWTSSAGGLPFNLAPFLTGETFTDRVWPGPAPEPSVRERLRDESPEELRIEVRDRLEALGAPFAQRDGFTRQRWLSPHHQIVIVDAIVGLSVAEDRLAMVDVAMTAESEGDARFLMRAAQMLAHYDRHAMPVKRLVGFETLIAAYMPDRRLIVPLLVDYLVWTQPAAELVESLRRDVPPDLDVREIVLLLSGSASERSRAELATRGVGVVENAFDPVEADRLSVDPAG